MKHTLQQVFHSGKFLTGFIIFMTLLLIVIFYPLIIRDDPLAIIGQGTFFPPGIYVNTFDTINSPTSYILMLDDAAAKRIANRLTHDDRVAMKEWLVAFGIPADKIDIANTTQLMGFWAKDYDPTKELPGMTFAKVRYYQRLNASLQGILSTEGAIIAAQNTQTGTLEQRGTIKQSDFVNLNNVANVRILPLGTENFGRDMLTELVKATGISLQIGLVAGSIATLIGLIL
jgi:peptide/nickel transport system permease protein